MLCKRLTARDPVPEKRTQALEIGQFWMDTWNQKTNFSKSYSQKIRFLLNLPPHLGEKADTQRCPVLKPRDVPFQISLNTYKLHLHETTKLIWVHTNNVTYFIHLPITPCAVTIQSAICNLNPSRKWTLLLLKYAVWMQEQQFQALVVLNQLLSSPTTPTKHHPHGTTHICQKVFSALFGSWPLQSTDSEAMWGTLSATL